MSWACAYTGITSIFNDRQRIGIHSSTPNPGTAVDFVNIAAQTDLRTIFITPGMEHAVVAAVTRACEHKEVHPVDFKYVVALKANDHMVEDMLEKKFKELCAMLRVPQLDLVLLPWPVPLSDIEYDRKERNRQAVTMRKTWSKVGWHTRCKVYSSHLLTPLYVCLAALLPKINCHHGREDCAGKQVHQEPGSFGSD